MRVIVLTGPKHCGKTAAARALAGLVNIPCIDLDAEIERRADKTVRQLYAAGPDTFRVEEAAALNAVLEGEGGAVSSNAAVATNADVSARAAASGSLPRAVIAAGGGLIDNGAAMEMVAGKPDILLVFLELDAATAWQRIAQNAAATGSLPPFLQTAAPQETHRLLHERRNAAYKKAAHLTIPAAGKTPEEIAHEIIRQGCGRL